MADHTTATRASRRLFLTASGHVDTTVIAEFARLADDHLGPEIDVLILDLTAVTRLDDQAATALLNLADHLHAADLPTELRLPTPAHRALTDAAARGRLRIGH